ncbi:MAG: hypothetical protein ACYC2G_12145, partial [Gemmatimonadaceae bacterium]
MSATLPRCEGGPGAGTAELAIQRAPPDGAVEGFAWTNLPRDTIENNPRQGIGSAVGRPHVHGEPAPPGAARNFERPVRTVLHFHPGGAGRIVRALAVRPGQFVDPDGAPLP